MLSVIFFKLQTLKNNEYTLTSVSD